MLEPKFTASIIEGNHELPKDLVSYAAVNVSERKPFTSDRREPRCRAFYPTLGDVKQIQPY